MSDVCDFNTWRELTEAKSQYCRFLDGKDWQALGNLMLEDFVLDLDGAGDQPILKGRDTALAAVRASIETAKTAHQVHNPEITLKGNEATVIWAMQDRVFWSPERPSITGYGHYHERWVKVDGSWKIATMKLVRLHIDFIPPQQS